MRLSYDAIGDVLYIAFETLPPGKYIVIENEQGDVLKIDPETKRVIGCSILSFKLRSRRGNIQIPEIGSVPFNDMAAELLSA
jgi:uncharacterized protein YuzE